MSTCRTARRGVGVRGSGRDRAVLRRLTRHSRVPSRMHVFASDQLRLAKILLASTDGATKSRMNPRGHVSRVYSRP